MHDLTSFALSDATRFSATLRGLGDGAKSMEEVGGHVVRHLYENLRHGPEAERSCALVRFYKTHPLGRLDSELQRFATGLLGSAAATDATKCLTLLATVGDQPNWNDRDRSAGHRAIPLPSEAMVSRFPMIVQMVTQFGLDIGTVLEPDPALLVNLAQRTYNVFHVPEALGSPFIPAQEDFVAPFGIQSALGFGGMLPSGDLFAVIMFTRVRVARETADLFEALALSVKLAILPFAEDRVFA